MRLFLIFGFFFTLTISLWTNRWTPVLSFLTFAILAVLAEAATD